MIKLSNITKYYENKFIKTFVLRNISLEIGEGEFISIMGPSGAGKSTLLYIIGMLDTASEGEYYFYGEPVHTMKEKKLAELHKSHIGFVFQQYHLIDELTVFDIDASRFGCAPNESLIAHLAAECRMPLCYGGGVVFVVSDIGGADDQFDAGKI